MDQFIIQYSFISNRNLPCLLHHLCLLPLVHTSSQRSQVQIVIASLVTLAQQRVITNFRERKVVIVMCFNE